MIKNYFKIAWRNLLKNKVYSCINIAGLAIGLTVSILILLFVLHEVSFDKFHVNGDRIYKIQTKVKFGEQEIHMERFKAAFAPTLREANPEILDFVRIADLGEVVIKNVENPSQKFKEPSFSFVDPSFFSIFSFKLKEGSANAVFQNPFSLVISEKVAKKLFGNVSPIGKTLWCDTKHTFTVTGIIENAPSNSTMAFDYLTSLETYPKLNGEYKTIWEQAGVFQTFLYLNSDNAVDKVEKSLPETSDKLGKMGATATYSLSQFSTQHLSGGFSHNTNARYASVFGGIALLILLLALFNYTSLTTARSTMRAKEVGIRKVIGGDRKELIQQFYIESLLMCGIAFSLAFVLSKLFLQTFFELSGALIDTSFLNSPMVILVLVGLFLFCTFIAGSYPALLLSKFAPIDVLKGKYTSRQGGSRLRKGITIFQFTASCVLIICVIVTQKQLNYMKNKDLGFNQSHILAVPVDESIAKSFLSFKNDIRQLAGVKSITSATTPFYKGYNAWFMKSQKSKKETMVFSMTTDENFFKTIELQWTKQPINMDNMNKKVFMNESAVKQLEYENDPIGQDVDMGEKKIQIGGVLKDFHFSGLAEEIKPLSISVYPENSTAWAEAQVGGLSTIYVRFEPTTTLDEKVSTVKSLYEKYPNEKPFEYYFLEEAFNETFKTHLRLSKMLSIFSVFAIFIACMGLFGLVAFAAETRTKEIGIRKVLGASIGQIIALLSKDFIKLIVISFVFAAPLAWYGMTKWLQDFPFRISIGWRIFASVGIGTLAIALLTVSFQAIKAAVANPVKSLRTE